MGTTVRFLTGTAFVLVIGLSLVLGVQLLAGLLLLGIRAHLQGFVKVAGAATRQSLLFRQQHVGDEYQMMPS